jgi:hypothetical protein
MCSEKTISGRWRWFDGSGTCQAWSFSATGRPRWQSIWQSGRCNSAGRDTTGWTGDRTRPAPMLRGITSRTGRGSLLIRRLQVRVLPGAQNRRSAARRSPKSMATTAMRMGTRLDDPDRFVIEDPLVPPRRSWTRPPRPPDSPGTLSQIPPEVTSPDKPGPLGGVERPRQAVRFARLIHTTRRHLGGPAVRAACGGNLSLPWLLRTVVPPGRPSSR